jgi:hypothetical protein
MDDGLRFHAPPERPALAGHSVFLSTSIPDPTRWSGYADPLEITDAVVAFARACLTGGLKVVTAAHPTIAPLLLYVAAELPSEHAARVVIYQSELFDDVLPPATRRFAEEGIGQVVWTLAEPGEEPVPGRWNESLRRMRIQMLDESMPAAAAFVGGMNGIADEFDLFGELRPQAPVYPLAGPGGEARRLLEEMTEPPLSELRDGRVYPTVWNRVLDDLEERL